MGKEGRKDWWTEKIRAPRLRATDGWHLGVATILALGGVLALIAIQLADAADVDATTLALAALAVVLLFGIFAPHQTGRVLERITSFKFAGIEVGLKELSRAERVSQPPVEEDGHQTTRPANKGLDSIRDKLRGRLRFVRLILELDDEVEEDDYRGIAGNLRERGLLSQDEERFTLDLLDETAFDSANQPRYAEKRFLDAAWAFAVRFGPMTWDREVRRRLSDKGWLIADFKQARGHRPFFLGHRKGKWALMSARVAGEKKKPFKYIKTGRRLKEIQRDEIDARWIVIPKIRSAYVVKNYRWSEEEPENVKVLRLPTILRRPVASFGSADQNRPPKVDEPLSEDRRQREAEPREVDDIS